MQSPEGQHFLARASNLAGRATGVAPAPAAGLLPVRSVRVRLSRKLHLRLDRDYPGAVTHVQESNNGLFSVRTIIERALVHIHADEAIGHLRIEVTSELHRIGERLFAMVQCVLN